ncbi:hypothetical protein FAK_03400 [Desulfoferula mesophila]|uniref:Uncharacterized protein n=2 Tax=Desulfoferula mesophila TaxID=3058419 RepID=A0AAU9EDE1_9BACT|nr:hypothetical protein FAK_03400 [Desulfoferula mesophilus]
MLPLAAAGFFITLGLRYLHRRALAIEAKPVDSTPGGLPEIFRDKFSHQVLGQSMLLVIFGGLALAGMAGLFLQMLIRPAVQSAVETQGITSENAPVPRDTGPSLDLIFLLALIVGAVTLGLAIYTYRYFRRRAEVVAGLYHGREAQRPLIVRWFHDSKTIGIVLLVIGGWLCFGMIMQVVGFILVAIPWPASLVNVSVPWATDAMIWILGIAGVVIFLLVLSPAIWMSVRHFKMDMGYYQSNRAYRRAVNIICAFGAAPIGGLLFIMLLGRLGIAPLTGRMFDFIPGIWLLSYLIAYVAAILIQVFLTANKKRRFSLINIGIAFLAAFPGAVLIFIPLSSLFSDMLFQ